MTKSQGRRAVTGAVTTALVVAGVTGVAGCGGSGSAAGASAKAGADTRSSAQLAADRKLARGALLTLSDFPEGWEAKPSDDAEGSDKFADELADCLDVPAALLGGDDDDSVDSPDFESPDNKQVSNSVAVAPTTDLAAQVFDILQQPNATRCFGRALDDELRYSMEHDQDAPNNLELGKVSMGELNLPRYADESVAFRATVPVSAEGINVDVYVDLVFMRHGRVASFVSFLDLLSPFPLDQAKHYAGLAAERLTGLQA